MTTSTQVPVQIHVDAATRIQELGLQKELDMMIERTRQTIPGLESIEVEAYESDGDEGKPHICLIAYQPNTVADTLRVRDEWISWFVRTFPPGVAWWFCFQLFPSHTNGR